MSMELLDAAGVRVERLNREGVNAVPDGWDRLVGEAIRFLRVGTLTFREWVGLMPVEQEAFQEAAEVVLAERASVHGAAAQSMESAMRVGARSDGGGTLADALLKTAVAGLAKAAPDAPAVPGDSP